MCAFCGKIDENFFCEKCNKKFERITNVHIQKYKNKTLSIVGVSYTLACLMAGIIAVITRGEIFENYVIVIVLSMCIYVKIILEMIQKLYHWITTESEENHYDIVKMTFIWTIIAFIIGKIW